MNWTMSETGSFGWNQTKLQHGVPALRVWWLTTAAGMAATVALCLMFKDSTYLLASLLAGAAAMAIDFAIEYAGISKKRWDYPRAGLPVRTVPLEVPLLFLSCGILATFTIFLFSEQHLSTLASSQLIAGLDLVQVSLLITASYFLIQYILGNIKTLVFWALPLSIAAYISFPEPWLLAISILPVYLDYYLERRLVKSSDITYEGYGKDVAINVSISYFPATLLILGIAALLLRLMGS